MFNTSLRQAARTCPNAAIAARNIPTPVSRTASTFSSKGHQRRHSSSKPPTPPNDGSSSIPATSVKQVGAPRSSEKRPGTESRLSKRKSTKSERSEHAKQVSENKGNEWTLALPSVPSTQHLHPKDVYVAAFFSTHRPISISGPLPETAIEDVDKIFQARPKKTKTKSNPGEVMYTINNFVQSLDEHIQNPQQNDPTVEQKADFIKALTQHNTSNQTQHLDGQPPRVGSVKLVIEEMAKRFRPFNTPPAPVPVPDMDFQSKEIRVTDAEAEAEAQAEANDDLQAQQLEIQVEMQEPLNQAIDSHAFSIKSGSFFTAHQSPITNPLGQPHRGGRTRRGVYIDPRRGGKTLKYQLISVKRQRRLKMKKHKYKKLMRKTRNLRRRQDRL